MVLRIILVVVALIVVAIVAMVLYSRHQMGKIPGLSFEETIVYSTQGKQNAVITVGMIQGDNISFSVYGEDGKELPQELHTYEIGSVTKTVTAALISRAMIEGKIDINNAIDCYLSLPEGKHYPTVKDLLTHTSGYKSHYFESPMISNFFRRRNSFFNISKDSVLKKVSEITLANTDHAFAYSNFGYAVLGLVLESVYGQAYSSLADEYLQQALGLSKTRISDGTGDLGYYWDWHENDAYISAGAITSNIDDMLTYLQIQMSGDAEIQQTHWNLKNINATSQMYKMMGIRLDDIGMAWIIDKESGIIWHNGGTGKYNSFIGFHPDSQTGVVVLSNLAPSDRIPATVMGIKLLKECLR